MRLHEYQAKEIFGEAGIPVPESQLADSVDGVLDAVDEIGYPAAVKAQVHVGGRGKAGGIKIATSLEEARDAAESILGMDLKGYTVDRVENPIDAVGKLRFRYRNPSLPEDLLRLILVKSHTSLRGSD